MDVTIASALIALFGSLAGTFGGIIVSAKLTTYRIEQLEKKVEKHNHLIERMYAAEKKLGILETRLESGR